MDERLFLPGSVSGLAALAQAVLVQVDAWHAVEGPGRVLRQEMITEELLDIVTGFEAS